MDPLLLQQQLVNNNQEFVDIFNDLKSWGKEMERKDQERMPQNQLQVSPEEKATSQEIKKQKVDQSNRALKEILDDKVVKKKCVTYADWDKFDADKECEKIDDDSDSNSDSLVDDLKDQALIEKDEGNKYVKVGKWNDAIRCYTSAIKYYAYDPVFYANRALCFLKTKQMERAEQDCNISLKLDNTYVKAYQRRAAARESLNKFEEARLDLLRVLELEPKNSESRSMLEKLTERIRTELQKPVSKFSKLRSHFKRAPSEMKSQTSLEENFEKSTGKDIDFNIPECIWPTGVVTNIVKAIQKPPHMRSTKPLKRITIKEINSANPESSESSEDNISKSLNKEDSKVFCEMFNTDETKVIEHKSTISISQVEVENVNKQESLLDEKIQKLTEPNTSVQFHLIWKQLKGHNDKRSEYLRLLNPQNIPGLFKDSLESEVFSEILLVLAEHFTKEGDKTYDYLLNLSNIKRFSALSMFFSMSDKNSLWKMFNHIKEFEGRSKEEIDNLIVKYEI